MISPPYLKRGDKIGITAPAGKLAEGIPKESIELIKNSGFEPVIASHVYEQKGIFSGTDEERCADLQQMLDDHSIKAIICARGGYGTIRIIDKINFTGFKNSPKWIVGFSDITVLHAHIHNQYETETIHGQVMTSICNGKDAAQKLFSVLSGKQLSYSLKEHALNKIGSCRGQLIGGNLSLLYSLQGSNSDIDTAGKILFIEDIGEYLYHIDRMLVSMKRSGKLHCLSGLIIGNFTEMKNGSTEFGKNAEEIIREHVEEYNYPVCFGFPSGHIDENYPMIFGRNIHLEVNNNHSIVNFHENIF